MAQIWQNYKLAFTKYLGRELTSNLSIIFLSLTGSMYRSSIDGDIDSAFSGTATAAEGTSITSVGEPMMNGGVDNEETMWSKRFCN